MTKYNVRCAETGTLTEIESGSDDYAGIARTAAHELNLSGGPIEWPITLSVERDDIKANMGIYQVNLKMIQVPSISTKQLQGPQLDEKQKSALQFENQRWEGHI